MYLRDNVSRKAVLMAALLLFRGLSFGQTKEEEPAGAVLELGGAAEQEPQWQRLEFRTHDRR